MTEGRAHMQATREGDDAHEAVRVNVVYAQTRSAAFAATLTPPDGQAVRHVSYTLRSLRDTMAVVAAREAARHNSATDGPRRPWDVVDVAADGSQLPQRLQRSRARGARLPQGAVYVGRPSAWGNPWRVVRGGCRDCWELWRDGARPPEDADVTHLTRAEAVEIAHESHLGWAVRRDETDREWLLPLRGRDLACWCPTTSRHCHADTLLELANRRALTLGWGGQP